MTDVAVVTGAARGFGLEIARRLLRRDMQVVVTDFDEAQLSQAAAGLGPAAHPVVCDVRDPEAHRRAAAAAAALGRVTVWVNNAGVAHTGKAWEHPDTLVDLTVGTNLTGTMHGSRAAVAAMRDTGGGQILNISSLSAHGPVPGLAIYAATKAAVLSFTMSLQGDLDIAGLPIRTHVLCPDAADTRMVRDVAAEEDAALLFSGVRLLDPSAVADAAMELLDSRAIVRTVPRWRSALVRGGALTPVTGLKVLRGLRWVGDRRRPEANG